MPVILATQEAEIRRITVQANPHQIVHKTLSRKSPLQKWAGRVVQGVNPAFKPQYCQKNFLYSFLYRTTFAFLISFLYLRSLVCNLPLA
jgi:hypothetical protein